MKVLDRTELILDIFASRAETHEARLAVELAQLEYAMPRLKRMWTHLSRQKKGVGPARTGRKTIGRRPPPGGTPHRRPAAANSTAIERRRKREVAARRGQMTVSLVGYTNAGKSTLMNALTGADVHVEDALFATLDTRTRRWQLPGWGPVLLSDTVGFIRDLPHHLIASFKATLEEARQADLLLHVADAANPAVYEQIAAAYQVLEEIGIRQKDTLLVLNKIDALPDRARLDGLLSRYPDAVAVSARNGPGAGATGRGGQRRPEPQFSRPGRGDGRGERPAVGLPGRPRRDPLEEVSRRAGERPLPHFLAIPRPDRRRRRRGAEAGVGDCPDFCGRRPQKWDCPLDRPGDGGWRKAPTASGGRAFPRSGR